MNQQPPHQQQTEGVEVTTTLREYWLILILLLAAMATVGYHFKQLLTGLTERTVAQVRVKR